jgi:RNA-binding protein 5/10
MEVLRKHETMSKLHLENLAKARLDKQAVVAEYRERDRTAVVALEKREREAATQEAEAKRQRLAEAAASSKPAQEAKAAAALEQGIGGKMLKMMGWKSGEGLGKRGTGITAPISASGTSASGGSSMAGLGARSALPVSIPESASYKERVQSFTRARYDATGEKEQ